MQNLNEQLKYTTLLCANATVLLNALSLLRSSSSSSSSSHAAVAAATSEQRVQLKCCYADTLVFAAVFVGPLVTGLRRTLTFPFDFLWFIKIVSSSLVTSDSDCITLLICPFPWPEQTAHALQPVFNMLHAINCYYYYSCWSINFFNALMHCVNFLNASLTHPGPSTGRAEGVGYPGPCNIWGNPPVK